MKITHAMKHLVLLFAACAALCVYADTGSRGEVTVTLYPPNAAPISYSAVREFTQTDAGISFETSAVKVFYVGNYLVSAPLPSAPAKVSVVVANKSKDRTIYFCVAWNPGEQLMQQVAPGATVQAEGRVGQQFRVYRHVPDGMALVSSTILEMDIEYTEAP